MNTSADRPARPTVGALLRDGLLHVAATTATARLDTELLLAHSLDTTRARLHAWPEQIVAEADAERYRSLIHRRAAGEPVAYLIGIREFWSMPLRVSPATLIPRPETETLVERALARIPDTAAWTVADLGTGCGAVALAIAAERPACRVIATDVSAAALSIAEANAAELGIANVAFGHGQWLEPMGDTPCHIIVSNPPYVPADDPHLRTGDLRFEPRAALISGWDGLDAISHIAAEARAALLPHGWLLLEHGHDQSGAVADLLVRLNYGNVEGYQDLAGLNRITAGRWPETPLDSGRACG